MYWPGRWPAEDGGPDRLQQARDWHGFGLGANPAGGELVARFRPVVAATMLVWRDSGELFVLTHSMGDNCGATVERIDPVTLEALVSSPSLPGGPMWPGGIAVHRGGDLITVFGKWVHRLAADDLKVIAAAELPGERPYNSFVVLLDGTLITKDFAKDGDLPSTLFAIDPFELEVIHSIPLPERSIARLSAVDSTIYVVGDTSLLRVGWDGKCLQLDEDFTTRYRSEHGQTYGWDCVLTLGAAWFLDNGQGTEQYAGSFVGRGSSPCPLHLVRVDLSDGSTSLHEVCGDPMGIVANPPLVDPQRHIVVAFDSANKAMSAWDIGDDGKLWPRWERRQAHAAHMLLCPTTGELLTHDHDGERMADQAVVLDIGSGTELARVDTGSPVQSVLFPAPGDDTCLAKTAYSVSFAGISRITNATE